MDAAGEVAQLLERGAGLRLRLVDELQGHAVRVVAQALAGHAELEAEGDEALLRAVVQVALDAAALGVGRGDDPRLRGAGVDHLRRELGVGLGVQEQPRPVAVRDAHAVDEVPGGDDQQRADRHRKHASGRLSTSQNRTSIPPGVTQYHRGASSSASGRTIAIEVRVNEMIPSGNWHARYAMSFHVCGSATRALSDDQMPSLAGRR